MTTITLTIDVHGMGEDAALVVGEAIAQTVKRAYRKDIGRAIKVSLHRDPYSREALARAYDDYRNGYLTSEKWAEHKGLDWDEGVRLIEVLRSCRYNSHPEV